MTDDERRALVADLVLEVMGLEMPCPRDPQPSGVSGSYWKIGDHQIHDNDEHIGIAIGYFWDWWRRGEAKRLIEERGLPAELVRAAWDAIPYESVPFRFGWEEWRRRREAALEAEARPFRDRQRRTRSVVASGLGDCSMRPHARC